MDRQKELTLGIVHSSFQVHIHQNNMCVCVCGSKSRANLPQVKGSWKGRHMMNDLLFYENICIYISPCLYIKSYKALVSQNPFVLLFNHCNAGFLFISLLREKSCCYLKIKFRCNDTAAQTSNQRRFSSAQCEKFPNKNCFGQTDLYNCRCLYLQIYTVDLHSYTQR